MVGNYFPYTGRYDSNKYIIQGINVYLILQAIWENNAYVTYWFLNSGNQGFFFWFPTNYTDFAHATLHIKPSKYDSWNIWYQNLQMFEKKLWGWGCGLEKHL